MNSVYCIQSTFKKKSLLLGLKWHNNFQIQQFAYFKSILIINCIHFWSITQHQPRMEKYRLVQEQKGDQDDIGPISSTSSHESIFPEVRITQQGKPRNYISYAMNLFVSIISSFKYIVGVYSFLNWLWTIYLQVDFHTPLLHNLTRHHHPFSNFSFSFQIKIQSGRWIEYNRFESYGSRYE